MKPEIVLAYEFVEYIPGEIKERTLYISETYGTAVHKCCCGCNVSGSATTRAHVPQVATLVTGRSAKGKTEFMSHGV